MRTFALVTSCSIAFALAVTVAHAASPYGNWLRPTTGGVVKVFKCKSGLGLRVIKSKDKAKLNKIIMCGARKTGANSYAGSILNLEDGKTYTGKVVIRGNKMDLSGCVLGAIFCKTETWQKTK